MQMLLQRNQGRNIFGRPIFQLWAKFELTGEESALIDKYHVRNFLLSEGNFWRDLFRSARWMVLITLILLFFLTQNGVPSVSALVLSLVVFGVGTLGLYQHLREQITVSDILDGRFFACRSVLTLMGKEQTVTGMAVVFRRFLEAMKTWGGKELIDIQPDQEPVLRLTEPADALSRRPPD